MKILFNNSQLKQLFFLVIILALTYLIISQLLFFLPSFLGALTLYILSRNFHRTLIYKFKFKSWVSVLITMLLTLFILSIPVLIFVELIFSKVDNLMVYVDKINQGIIYLEKYLKYNFGFDIFGGEVLKSVSVFITNNLTLLINSGVNVLSSVFFSYFIFYFMLSNSNWLETSLFKWLPIKITNTEKIRTKFYKMVVSNTVGIPIVAVAQGIAGLIGYYIIGLNDIWFWFLITIFASAIPIVGSSLAYIPIALTFFANNRTFEGVFILIWGIVVIGGIDNICRFTLLKKMDDIHPLITVFGIIFGINVFGFLGLIFGPLLISMLFILIQIYKDEYSGKIY